MKPFYASRRLINKVYMHRLLPLAVKLPSSKYAGNSGLLYFNKISRSVGLAMLFLMAGYFAIGQISTTGSGGNWNSTTTWQGGVVPSLNNSVTIQSSATVTVNTDTARCASITVGSSTGSGTATLSFTNLGVLTVSGNVVLGGGGQRKGSLDMTNGGTLKVGNLLTLTTLGTFTRGTGTIEYNGGGQTVTAIGTTSIYNNLILSGSGAKAIASSSISIVGTLSISGSATASITAGLNISVGTLKLGGLNKASGTWGSLSATNATNKTNTYFTSGLTGIITVTTDTRPTAVISGVASPSQITYGTPTVTLSGTLSDGGSVFPVAGETVAVTINGVTQNAVVSGTAGAFTVSFPVATFNVAASYTISYAYAGGENLKAAVTNTNTSLSITRANIDITAADVKKTYGTTITGGAGSTAFSVSGLQNGETIGSVTITYGAGAASTSPVANYATVQPSLPVGGTFLLSNYRPRYVLGNIIVNPAPLTITANDVTKAYGTTITGASGSTAFTATGLQNGETVGTVTIAYGTGAAATANVGNYTTVTPSLATGGSFLLSNYQPTYVAGKIIVTAAPLTITANNLTKAYGVAVTFLNTEYTSSGLVNGDIISSLTISSTGAPATAPVSGSPYPVVTSNVDIRNINDFPMVGNYSITYVNGVLTVTGVSQASADFRSKTAGNFSLPATWQYDQGGNSWADATQVPASVNNISIGHAIILDQNYTTGGGKILLISTGGSLTVEPGSTLAVSSGGSLNFNDNPVTIKSTATGAGAIGRINGTLTGATNVTVERFIGTAKRAWRLLTIPVTGTTIRQAWAGVAPNPLAPDGEIGGSGTIITGTGYASSTTANAAGFDWFSGLGSATSSSIRFYTPAAAWASANTPNILAAPAKEGYLMYIRGDRTIASNSGFSTTTLKPTGTLKQKTQTIPVNDSFTVIGNPYAASIYLDNMYANTGNDAVINRNFWVWDANLGTTGAYRLISWNGVDQYDMTGGSGNPSDYLVVNSGQAFFVEMHTAGSIAIQESNKIAAAGPGLFRPADATSTGVSSLQIKLYQAAGNTLGLQADMVVARFNDLYKAAPTEVYDAAKLNNINENLSLVRNNKYLSIESRPFPTQQDTLYVPFWGLSQRSYALSFAANKFTGINQTARLLDAFTNKAVDIDLGDNITTYPFTVTSDPASSSLSRFKIVLTPISVLPVSFTKINAGLVGNKVQVSWATGSELNVKNYAIERSANGKDFTKIGELAAKQLATGASYQWEDLSPVSGNGFYRIRSNDQNGKYAFSNIVIIQSAGKKGMQVFPTVISDQQFTLLLNGQPAGNYRLLLTNEAGQQVFQKTITSDGGNSSQSVDLGKRVLAAGIYHLSVGGVNGINQNFRLVINK